MSTLDDPSAKPPTSIPSPDAKISTPDVGVENADAPPIPASNFPAEMKVSEVTLPQFSTRTTDSSSLASISTRDIPLIQQDKVFCRQKEVDTLFRVYQEVKSGKSLLLTRDDSSFSSASTGSVAPAAKQQLVMIHGETGVGKSCLAQILRETVLKDGGFFVSGKFDAYQTSSEPHYAFSSAFAMFCNQVLERGETTKEEIRNKVLDKVGREGKVLTDMIAEMELILGPQEALDQTTGGSEAVHRFKYVFKLFLDAISSPERPLVLLLDDLHFADESSLGLLWSLLNSTNPGVIFLCTVMDDVETSVLDKHMAHLNERLVEVTKIQLEPFTEEETNVFLSETLGQQADKTEALTNVVSRQTKGNPFFIVEFLRALRENDMLVYSKTIQAWTYDIEEVDLEFGDVRNLIQQRLNSVSAPLREMLKTASCLGSRLDEAALSYLMEDKEPFLKLLVEGTERGLLNYNDITGSVEFAHGAIRGVVYQLIPKDDRERFHYQIGRRLWRAYPKDHLLDNNIIYVIVGQLIVGCECIQEQRERSAVAKLCLQAGMRATRQSSFMTAHKYLMTAIQLLGSRRWYDDYQLSLALHNFAAEVGYCTGNFDCVFQLVSEIDQHAKDLNDKLGAKATQTYALGSSGKMSEAIDCALEVLQQLDVEFADSLTWKDVDKGLKKMQKLLKGRSTESFLRLPSMKDPVKIAAMQMLNLIFVYAFISKAELAPFIGFKMVEMTVEHGICGVSCVGFVLYAMFLCGIGDDIEEGFKFGKLALQMYEKNSAKVFFCRVSAAYYGCVHGWKRPVPEAFQHLKQAYLLGLESGDIEFAMLNANVYCWSRLSYSTLAALDRDISRVADRMGFYGQQTNLVMIRPMWQMLHNLMGLAKGDPRKLVGEIYDESELDAERFPTVHHWSCFHRLLVCYMIEDFDQAYEQSSGCEILISRPFGAVDVADVIFFVALSNVEMATKTKKNRKYIHEVERHLKKISHWAEYSPLNFLGFQYLLEAKLAVLKGDVSKVFSLFTSAVALFSHAGMLMNTALANELAAKHFLSTSDRETALPFLKDAFRLYQDWGCALKLKILEQDFGHLLPSTT